MSFKIKPLDVFLRQLEKLGKEDKEKINEKILLIKENPYRFKRIHSKEFSKTFRIRLNLSGKETRLIYVLLEPNIIMVCLLERKKNYHDLEKYLSKIKKG